MVDSQPESQRQGKPNPVDAIVESYVNQLRRGEQPPISEYTSRHPELAEEIRSIFPTLAMREECNEDEAPENGQPAALAESPKRLGEYRIIREIGRGGMGVVYEAEHDTMRRRVALKVFPVNSTVNPIHVERFHREARTAGRLHHSNIVPVFEVGVHDGLHFYAMHFIQGQNLDVVFDELREAQRNATALTEPDFIGTIESPLLSESVLGKSVELTRLSVQEERNKTQFIDSSDDNPPPPPIPVEQAEADPVVKSVSEVVATSSSTGLLRGGTDFAVTGELANTTSSRSTYYQRVARIGLQVAESLAYAHSQATLQKSGGGTRSFSEH